MSEALDRVYRSIDEQNADKSAATRRQLIAGAAVTVGGLGVLGAVPGIASADVPRNDPQTILNVATTAEVLATIVNTVGWERGLGGDPTTQRNIRAAAREELIHYQVLRKFGGKPATRSIWIPDAVFASRKNLLNTLQVGDQIFINAYLIATRTFGDLRNGEVATIAAEFMGAEAVHRALARQSLGLLGNDRVFMKWDQKETAPGSPNLGQRGFENVLVAVTQLQAAGFGFGAKGAQPGRFYSFNQVRQRTPDDPAVNTRTPDAD